MVFRSASSFMWATISTLPDLASVTTAVTSPSASDLGAKAKPSSMSCGDGGQNGSNVSPPPGMRALGAASKGDRPGQCPFPSRHGYGTRLGGDGEILQNKRTTEITAVRRATWS